MATYLDRIIASHREKAAADARSLPDLLARAADAPATRGFASTLRAAPTLAVIAEVKRRSPSKGDLQVGLDPAVLARRYEAGGAAALSVLTDEDFFGGSAEDLVAARAATSLPTLRKDFTVCAHDVADARLMGADCLLLIVSALADAELAELAGLADQLGLDVLVEVHDEEELARAMGIGPAVVGVNQRDLVTFEVDTERAVRMAPLIPPGVLRVAESGIGGRADAEVLARAGYDAILVGETLVRSSDPVAEVRSLSVPRRP